MRPLTSSGGGFLKAGGVDQAQFQAVEHRLGDAAVAGHARRVMDNGDAPPDQAVEETGFADIGPADDGECERHGTMSLPQRHQFGVIGIDIDRAVGHHRAR